LRRGNWGVTSQTEARERGVVGEEMGRETCKQRGEPNLDSSPVHWCVRPCMSGGKRDDKQKGLPVP